MLRLLILLAGGLLIAWLLRKALRGPEHKDRDTPAPMIHRCAECGVYVPESELGEGSRCGRCRR